MSAADSWIGLAPEEGAQLSIAPAPARGRAAITDGRKHMRRYRDLLMLTDIVVVIVAVGVALLGRFGVDSSRVNVLGYFTDYWVVAGVIALTWIGALAAYRSRDLRIIGSGTSEYKRVSSATAMLFGLIAIVMLVLKVDVARGFVIIAFPVGLVCLLLGRKLWRAWLLRQRSHGAYTAATVIVGPRLDVERTLRTILTNTGSAYRPVGVILQDPEPDAAITVSRQAIPVIGSIDDVAGAVRSNEVDAVIVAGQPSGGGDFIRDLGWALERTDAELMIASRLANVAGPRIHFRPADGMPLMHVELPSYEGGKHLVKRALDVAVSALALIILWPLFVVLAILIKHEDSGPVYFRQSRVGRNGAPFSMIKFRSMVPHAEERLAELADKSDGNGILFKLIDDPRITKVGRVLRKYSLDELPQLWNVLIGQMSLVGPRPPLPSEVERYEDHVLRRLYIKPGLTGMWQINGRSNLSWEDSVRLDLFYVENWSLAGDLLILWRTAKVVLKPVGAY